ncbi:MAG: type II secretion system protein [Verrucomicrobiae bacterium]|nr:type II secretion system protein [Verrucomicrobiae bacterium]
MKKAFLLLEVMLALGVFSVAAVGLLYSLNAAMERAYDCAMVGHVREQTASRLAELRLFPLKPGKTVTTDEHGVRYQLNVEPLHLQNCHGVDLANLFRVRMTVSWNAHGGEWVENNEIYVRQTPK